MRKFQLAAAAALVALSLGACQSIQAIQGFTVTQGQLDAAQNTYDGTVLAPLHKYAALKACPAGQKFSLTAPCHESALLKQIRAGDKVAAKAFSDTQDMITSGNNTGAVAAYKSLQTAVQTVQGLIAVSGAGSL
jgi:hypothetical protein